MSKLDDFKIFVSKHPEFVNYKKNNNVTWQSLYELYDLYGEDMSVWNKYLSTDSVSSINISSILNTLKNINLDSLEENLSSIQKAVSLVSELTSKEDNKDEIKGKEERVNSFFSEE